MASSNHITMPALICSLTLAEPAVRWVQSIRNQPLPKLRHSHFTQWMLGRLTGAHPSCKHRDVRWLSSYKLITFLTLSSKPASKAEKVTSRPNVNEKEVQDSPRMSHFFPDDASALQNEHSAQTSTVTKTTSDFAWAGGPGDGNWQSEISDSALSTSPEFHKETIRN